MGSDLPFSAGRSKVSYGPEAAIWYDPAKDRFVRDVYLGKRLHECLLQINI